MHHADCTLHANELASQPCRDAPVKQATAIPAISASPLPHLDRCAAAYREEYGGNEYGWTATSTHDTAKSRRSPSALCSTELSDQESVSKIEL
jgi:hypothetical protein